MTLKDEFARARDNGSAIAHFNVSDSTQFNAVLRAAKRADEPVAIGVSEGEGEFIGMGVLAGMVKAARDEGARVYLNADHSYSIERAKHAIDLGFDSVIIDGAKLSFDENIAMTRALAAYAKGSEKEVLVEGELGYIGTSSKIHATLPEGVAITEEAMTSPEELSRFIAETQVNLIAPSVGNVHGIIASGEPRLSIRRIEALAAASSVPLVLHGGSGTLDEDFVAAIKAGIRMVHINTELRVAYRKGLDAGLAADAEEVAPYRFLKAGADAVEEVAYRRIMLFSNRVSL